MLITHSRIWGQHWIALQKQQESGWVKVLGCCPNGCMSEVVICGSWGVLSQNSDGQLGVREAGGI